MMPYWSQEPAAVAYALGTTLDGLSSEEAARRLARSGPNEIRRRKRASRMRVLWRQIRSPLILLLVFAAAVSIFSGEWVDASIVGAIVAASVGIGYWREYGAETAIAALLDRIQTTANVVRDGAEQTIPLREVVPGDVIILSAGSIVPADALLLEATDLHVDEALLTGESFPTLKEAGVVAAANAAIRARKNCVHFGSNVRSGGARAIAVKTGRDTELGAIADRVARRAPETDFERGLRRFGLLLLVAMLIMIVIVFAVNVLLGRPVIDTLLFAIALAVGLSPELLPAILSTNLARSAQLLAKAGVLVRRLDAIENLGSMTVLCTDKTGTLTEGVVRVDGAFDARGVASSSVMDLAVLNAALHTGVTNPMDQAILDARAPRGTAEKLAEIPYDFMRKRVSVVVREQGVVSLIMKGAVSRVLAVCTRLSDGTPLDTAMRADIEQRHRAWAAEGIRVLAVARRTIQAKEVYGVDDERDLELAGFVTLFDRPKADAGDALRRLADRGVRVKMITGDSRYVARHVAEQVELRVDKMLTAQELTDMTDVALHSAVVDTDIFAEVDPNQKERIIRAIRHGGEVVGFFGDGVNDTPAMHAADVSISVESAVDVAKSTADLVLTRKALDVIDRGIEEGRRTFANTLKYVLTTTSANVGNMISMAAASLVLPFLPLTAGQILLNNFLSDIPAVGIASDCVDPELVERPRRWDMRFIARFMLEFGTLSSAFDALTFIVLVFVFNASPSEFRTGWFVESLFTELVIALVVRTRRRFWASRVGSTLVWTTTVVVVIAFTLSYVPIGTWVGFVAPPSMLMIAVVVLTAAYVGASELLKSWFYRSVA